MKKKGNVVAFTGRRNEELLEAYKQQLGYLGMMPLWRIWERIAQTPASRFWVSEFRAYEVMLRIRRGDRLLEMIPKRREMFFEIYMRVRELMEDEPDLRLTQAVDEVVNSPAPEFYLTPRSVRTILYRFRKKQRAERREKQQNQEVKNQKPQQGKERV